MLPPMKDYLPPGTGRPRSPTSGLCQHDLPKCGGPAERETDTLDGFACRQVLLRFASPHEDARPFDRRAVDRWLPVDLYVAAPSTP